ncbi:MAG: ATP-binding cassette domain-containing protein [Candidatus Omnitrophica bacterium]|nr:ATP-binding cassette domain-containing protein [Candidatus Omnitrophota bacterium]
MKKVEQITIIGGRGRTGAKEPVTEVNLKMGNVVSIVGPTGSGKTELINDIELSANENTPSCRKILFNGAVVDGEFINDPSKNPIALITQHTNFLSDLPVDKFLNIHAKVRGMDKNKAVVEETLSFANQLTGEPVILSSAMTDLSGGQTRALLIADAVVIGNSPIILLDEIENAGIHRTRAIELLKHYEKIFIFVTHDPRIALFSDFRIVMKNGAMQKVIVADEEEKRVAEEIKKLDDILSHFRTSIRDGERVSEEHLEDRLKALEYI